MLRRADTANRAEVVARCYAAGVMRQEHLAAGLARQRCLTVA